MNVEGLIVGVVSFVAIGLFHPLVIKGEYHFGVRIWPLFAVLGLICLTASCLVECVCVSSILAVVGFCSLWAIGELFKQRERVKKGWFPKKPVKNALSAAGALLALSGAAAGVAVPSPWMAVLVDGGSVRFASLPAFASVRKAFEAATVFARTEGTLPAPESAHAIRAAMDEALRCKREGKAETNVFGLTGTGYFDMFAYGRYNDGQMSDYIPTDDDLAKGFAGLPCQVMNES